MGLKNLFHRSVAPALSAEEAAAVNGYAVLGHIRSYEKADYEDRDGLVKKIDTLIGKGADLTVKDVTGNTALLLVAASYFNLSALLPHIITGSDLEATNNDGETALDIAVKAGSETLVRLLLDRKAHVSAETIRYSDIRGTARSDNAEISRMLKVALRYQSRAPKKTIKRIVDKTAG